MATLNNHQRNKTA